MCERTISIRVVTHAHPVTSYLVTATHLPTCVTSPPTHSTRHPSNEVCISCANSSAAGRFVLYISSKSYPCKQRLRTAPIRGATGDNRDWASDFGRQTRKSSHVGTLIT